MRNRNDLLAADDLETSGPFKWPLAVHASPFPDLHEERPQS